MAAIWVPAQMFRDWWPRAAALPKRSKSLKASPEKSWSPAGNTAIRSRPCWPMPRYEIIIYWSQADQAFIAEVPELPGCAADGKTYKEALANVEIIIQEWVETAKELGRPIPAPRGRLAFA